MPITQLNSSRIEPLLLLACYVFDDERTAESGQADLFNLLLSFV